MSRSRESILASLRRQRLELCELPPATNEWTTYEDPCSQFVSVLQAVGGQARVVDDHQSLAQALAELPEFSMAAQRCCDGRLPTEIQQLEWNVDLADTDDPHTLASLDFAILPGEFCVAENAAVWVTDRRLRQRAVYFISQHLALVVPSDRILHNMHQAYAELRFDDNAFGCFVSGPSKTADIEQSLVIGAHGARSLTVFLVRS